MASTDLGTLEPQLFRALGGDELAPDFLTRMDLLIQAVPAFNAATHVAFGLTGTVLDRDASPMESRALVLFAALDYLNGKAVEAAGMAIRHTNVAGTTDLGGQVKAYEVRITKMQGQLAAVMERLTDHAIAGEVNVEELGESKNILLSRPPFPLWGWDGRW